MGTVVQFPRRRPDDTEALLDQIRRLVESREGGTEAEDELARLRSRLAAVVRAHPPDAA
jgi:hypothetical protein